MTVTPSQSANSKQSKQDKNDYSFINEIAVGTIWIGFYLAIAIVSLSSPALLNTMELATR